MRALLRTLLVCAIAVVACLPAAAQTPSPMPSGPVPPLDQIAWVLGGTWHGLLAPDTGSVDVSYDTAPSAPYAIRLYTRFTGGRGRTFNSYVGVLYYDAVQKQAKAFYVDGEGTVTEGTMSIGPGTWKIFLKGRGEDFGMKGPIDLTVEVVRTTPNQYIWTLYGGNGADQKKLFAITYNRIRVD